MHYYCTMGDVIVKESDKVSVFVLDDRLIEDVDSGDVGVPMVIHYVDGDTYIYDNVVSFEQTDRGFWVETESLNFRFDNYYKEDENEEDDEDSLAWYHDTEETISGHELFEEFDF